MIIYFCSDLNKKKSFGLEKSIIPIKKKLKTKGLKIYIFKKINFKTIKNIFNCKIVHIHGCWSFSNFICFIISKFLKKKLIFSPHGMLDPVPLSIKKLKKKIALFFYQKNILKLSDYILVNSKLEKKNIRRLEKNKRIIVIPHAVDNYNIKKKKNKKKIKLVYFSRIHPIKNLKELIEIFTCRKEFSKYNLDIIGNIEDKKYFFEIQSIIKNFNYINVKKIKKNKYEMLEKYDVLIHPSKSENFGIVILEALLSGLYIIAGKNIPFNSLKKNGLGKNIIFNKNNLNKSLIRFQKFFFNSNQYKLKLHYNNYVKNNFSWKIITKKYIDFYTLVSK